MFHGANVNISRYTQEISISPLNRIEFQAATELLPYVRAYQSSSRNWNPEQHG